MLFPPPKNVDYPTFFGAIFRAWKYVFTSWGKRAICKRIPRGYMAILMPSFGLLKSWGTPTSEIEYFLIQNAQFLRWGYPTIFWDPKYWKKSSRQQVLKTLQLASNFQSLNRFQTGLTWTAVPHFYNVGVNLWGHLNGGNLSSLILVIQVLLRTHT